MTASTHPPAPARSWAARIWDAAQFLLALTLTGATLAFLLWWPHGGDTDDAERLRPPQVVRVSGPGLVAVDPKSTLADKLKAEQIDNVSVQTPAMHVTGTVVASRRPGKDKGGDYWQFNTPELLTTYTDWQKALADITFYEAQVGKIGELAQSRIKAQMGVVARLVKLVEGGSDAQKDLDNERNNLTQLRIQSDKDTYEARNTVKLARRSEAALARQLQQTGLDPGLLQTATADMDIVMADVPEARLRQVREGQGCQARFFGLPGELLTGKVTSISPVVTRERRTLRVLFVVHDPRDLLRPGMFAEIGLGTDPRQALLVPADGVLHVGRSDYVLVSAGPDTWRAVEVTVGEQHGARVEIEKGLRPGQRVVTQGAILLKPAVARALQPNAGAEGGGR